MFSSKTVRQYTHEFQPKKKSKKKVDNLLEGDIPTSGEISGIELRLSRVHIIDNRTPNIGPFPGYAKVYFITIVASDVNGQGVSVDVKAFPKVDDKEDLPIDNTLYYWKKGNSAKEPPSQIHVFTSVIKSKQSLRETGKIIQEVTNDSNYKSAVKTVVSAVSSASPVGIILDVITNVANIVGGFLGKVEDKPLLSVLQSYTDINGDFDVLGKVFREYKNRNAILGLSLTVRDKEREQNQ